MQRTAALAAGIAVLASNALAAPLTPAQQRGKLLYTRGLSASGVEVKALLGTGGFEVSASLMACANCHGNDGRGSSEGGVNPSNLTWDALTKPYGVEHESGRKHPPYDEAALKRAIVTGLDPAGNELHTAMPRYLLSHQDAEDLIAYLKVLGRDQDPGVDERTLRLASIFPSEGPMADTGHVLARLLEACFDSVNAEGGVYQRRILWRPLFVPLGRSAGLDSLRRALTSETPPFALAPSLIAGQEAAIAALLDSLGVPLVGALTRFPQRGFPLNRYVFYLDGGLEAEARALASYKARKAAAVPAAVLVPNDSTLGDLAAAMLSILRDGGDSTSVRVTYERQDGAATSHVAGDPDARESGADMRRTLERLPEETGAILFLGTDAEGADLCRAAASRKRHFDLYVPGSSSGRALLEAAPAVVERMFVAVATLPLDRGGEAKRRYEAVVHDRDIPARHLPLQYATWAAARILLEGLQAAGRDVRRETLIDALEDLYDWDTGMTRPVRYGPNRRIGLTGVWVVPYAPGHGRMSANPVWVPLDR